MKFFLIIPLAVVFISACGGEGAKPTVKSTESVTPVALAKNTMTLLTATRNLVKSQNKNNQKILNLPVLYWS